MKVLLVCPNRRTIAQWAPFFQELAAQHDIAVDVLTSHIGPAQRRELTDSHYYPGAYQLNEIGAIFRKLSEKGHSAPLIFSPAIRRVIARVRPEIVYVLGESGYAASWQTTQVCRKYAPEANICVRQAQNIYRRWSPPFNFFERYNYRHVDCIFASGRQQAEVLAKKNYRGRIELMPLGVDTNVFHKRDAGKVRSELNLDVRFVIGYVGKLTRAKGIPVLLSAFRQMPGSAHLLIIGEGPLGGMVSGIATDPAVGERVSWIKGVAHTQLPQYFSAMDVMVLPSVRVSSSAVQRGVPIPWMEQFGRVLVEAMACETPVIGSSSGSIPSVVGEAGAIFAEGDAQELAAKLSMAMDDASWRRRCKEKGLMQVRETYAWSRIARRYAEVFAELTGGSSS